MSTHTNPVPKKIWILWYQGLSEAPLVVKKCVDSWIKLNPDWEVILLDTANLNKFIVLDVPPKKLEPLSLTLQSDLIRIQLLAKYGGVWADATTLCMRPLDDWLYESASSGFFAFHRPGPDRVLSSWFLVSERDCPLVLKMSKRFTSFWIDNNLDNRGRIKRRVHAQLIKLLNKSDRTTKYWFSPIVTKIFGVYPYFIFHYMFERLVAEDSECNTIWKNTKKISADEPLKIHNLGLFSSLNDEIKREIDSKQTPIYKLTWKFDSNKYSSSTLLYYLLEGRDQKPI